MRGTAINRNKDSREQFISSAFQMALQTDDQVKQTLKSHSIPSVGGYYPPVSDDGKKCAADIDDHSSQ